MNTVDIAELVLYQKLITVESLNSSNVFNTATYQELDYYCQFHLLASDELILPNNYTSAMTTFEYSIKVWRKIKDITIDYNVIKNIIEKIDSVLVGNNINATVNEVVNDILQDSLYTVKSIRRTGINRDNYSDENNTWECRGGIYRVIVAGNIL